jgi:iron(III) transport system ATP-binding protein
MTPTADTVIRARGVARSFGPVTAVAGVDLDVHRGQILALLGPSGCGKTTMLRLIAGFERPDAGSIEIDGRAVASARTWVPPERRRVGMVFQDYALFPHLTVARNIAFGLPTGRRRSRGRQQRVAQALELVGLTALANRYPHQLSGGQQQRVALARALAPGPSVVLLDEPFSNLDAALRTQVRTDVHRILTEAGATAVFVTHDQEEALALADEVAVMGDGQLCQLATPEQLYRFPADRSVAAFVGDAELVPGQGFGTTVHTDLGELTLAQPAVGDLEVLLRPEELVLSPDDRGDATVLSREFYGHDQMLFLRLSSGRIIRARLGPVCRFAPGDQCSITIPGAVRAFPREA